MFRRFLRKHLPRREHLHQRWYLRPFHALLHDPALWAVHRKGVARAVAIGLFVAFLPIMPLQLLLVCLLAVWLRVNLPVAVVVVFVNNPLTMVQMYYLDYRVGTWLLGRDPVGFPDELSLQLLVEQTTRIGTPLLLGSLLVGLIAGLLGYLVSDGLWRLSLFWRFRRRSRRQRERLENL
ncbi:MAG: DUF2062 domain-containing protein [Gammaproteobacteria bacterium]|nr:DUF2062 domain-containing protein [Gammaproteobacteria bacterium]